MPLLIIYSHTWTSASHQKVKHCFAQFSAAKGIRLKDEPVKSAIQDKVIDIGLTLAVNVFQMLVNVIYDPGNNDSVIAIFSAFLCITSTNWVSILLLI